MSQKNRQEQKARFAFDFFCNVTVPGVEEKACRVHACLAFQRTYFSVTIRKPPLPHNAPSRPSVSKLTGKGREERLRLGLDVGETPEGEWLETQYRVAQETYKGIFNREEGEASGLVLITGETGSGKSTLLNFLLSEYLGNLVARPGEFRRPHVVVVGDPVETQFFLEKEDNSPESIAKRQQEENDTRLIDYTARTLRLDTPSVRSALVDALRETPAAYVISELRDEEDFFGALDFAATGHLIFATSHNTSLVDALGKLMRICEADNPSDRASLAQRIKAIVHLRPLSLKVGRRSYKTVLPTIWRGNPSGVRNFVADGLASLLPHGVGRFERKKQDGMLGLAWIAHNLKDRRKLERGSSRKFDELLRRAYERDLEIR